MHTETWALVTFTILAQTSVGSFIALGVAHYFAVRKSGIEQADKLSDRALLPIGGLLVLGMIASLLHLGQPMYAYRAILNFGNSWLSREIGFGVMFAATGAAFAFLQWRKLSTANVRNAVAVLAAFVGCALVFSMSQVYMTAEAQEGWTTVATPISFFATTVLLGTLALAVAFMINYWIIQRREGPECQAQQCDLLRGAIKWLAVTAIVVLGVELVVSSLQSAYVVSIEDHANLDFLGEYGVLFGVRLALAFVGAGIFGLFMYQASQSPGREKLMAAFAFSAFAFILVAEVLGRVLFYATEIHIGL